MQGDDDGPAFGPEAEAEPYDPARVHWFGPEPFARACAPGYRIDVPTDQACAHCGEALVDGDHGYTMLNASLGRHEPFHADCHLRLIVGPLAHVAGWCRCHGGTVDVELEPEAMTRRQQARAAVVLWRRQQGLV